MPLIKHINLANKDSRLYELLCKNSKIKTNSVAICYKYKKKLILNTFKTVAGGF